MTKPKSPATPPMRFRRVDEEPLRPAIIKTIADEIHKGERDQKTDVLKLTGEPDPEQSKRLLRHFVKLDAAGQPMPGPLLEYLRMAFSLYLDEGISIERALGLRRRKGRATLRKERNQEVARQVLCGLLKGDLLAVVAGMVAKHFYLASSSNVADVWALHKGDAFTLEAARRASLSTNGRAHWTAEECKRLAEIYPDSMPENVKRKIDSTDHTP